MKKIFISMIFAGMAMLFLPSCVGSTDITSDEVKALTANVQAVNTAVSTFDFNDTSTWSTSAKATWVAMKALFKTMIDAGLLPGTTDAAKTKLDALVTLGYITQSQEDTFLKAYAYFLKSVESESLAKAKLGLK